MIKTIVTFTAGVVIGYCTMLYLLARNDGELIERLYYETHDPMADIELDLSEIFDE